MKCLADNLMHHFQLRPFWMFTAKFLFSYVTIKHAHLVTEQEFLRQS